MKNNFSYLKHSTVNQLKTNRTLNVLQDETFTIQGSTQLPMTNCTENRFLCGIHDYFTSDVSYCEFDQSPRQAHEMNVPTVVVHNGGGWENRGKAPCSMGASTGRGGPDPQNLDRPPNFLRSFLMNTV